MRKFSCRRSQIELPDRSSEKCSYIRITFQTLLEKNLPARCQWLKLILANQEAEIRRLMV
jgi:hypothetical protein